MKKLQSDLVLPAFTTLVFSLSLSASLVLPDINQGRDLHMHNGGKGLECECRVELASIGVSEADRDRDHESVRVKPAVQSVRCQA